MLQRFLDPATLASIDGLDLIAKTVVDGFVAGLHRSPGGAFGQAIVSRQHDQTGEIPLHVPLKRTTERLVEVAQVEGELPFRRRARPCRSSSSPGHGCLWR